MVRQGRLRRPRTVRRNVSVALQARECSPVHEKERSALRCSLLSIWRMSVVG